MVPSVFLYPKQLQRKLVNLAVGDDPSHLGSEIIKKSLFAQTQTHCHNRVLTETRSGLTGGWCDDPQTATSVTIRRLSTILPTGSEMMYSSYVERNTQTQMTFIDGLIASGYVLDEENFDEGCYVKTDADGFIHIYQIGEDEGEWNYVKMTEDFDVLTEKTFTV